MRIQLIAVMAVITLVASIALAGEAFAQKSQKNDLKAISDAYKKAVQKAQADFQAAVKKANADAKAAIGKGVPINEINENSKNAIQKARADLKAAITKAQDDARSSLMKIKAAVDARTK